MSIPSYTSWSGLSLDEKGSVGPSLCFIHTSSQQHQDPIAHLCLELSDFFRVLGFHPWVQLSFSVSSLISRKLNFISLLWFAFSWTVISPWLKQEWFAYYTLALSRNCIRIGDIMGCLLNCSLHNVFLIGQLQWTKHFRWHLTGGL